MSAAHNQLRTKSGFTLIEMLLVMVIISIIIYASISYMQQRALSARIDRTAGQMQQILNAGLSYYIDHSVWPDNMSDLQGRYLPSTALTNPWAQSYQVFSYPPGSNNPTLFYVYTTITSDTASGSAGAAASAISGLLPLAYTTSSSGSPPPDDGSACDTGVQNCQVVASVNIPGQNLNNARAINFAGLYHHGACVPVPSCPVDATNQVMVPQIMVVPVSVSGVNDASSTSVYPISSFTAYATSNLDPPTDTNPPPCQGSTAANTPSCTSNVVGAASAYWRVCMQVVTEKGDVQNPARSDRWGQYVTMMAVTRCATQDEPAGSTFDVYSN